MLPESSTSHPHASSSLLFPPCPNLSHTHTRTDLKPQNILLQGSFPDFTAKLADVGLSTFVDLPSQMSFVSAPVRFGVTGGTVAYADPDRKENRWGPKVREAARSRDIRRPLDAHT